MSGQTDRRWITASAIAWAVILAAAIALAFHVYPRSPDILRDLVSTDPSPTRQALYRRLEADRLVHEAFARHEAAMSGTPSASASSGTLVAEAAPFLEQAERLYLASLDAVTSQPALLFQLGEVSFLRGRRAQGYLYLSRYWEAVEERGLARAYSRLAQETDPSATIPLQADAATFRPGK